jgi:hypothetical protein
MANTVQIYANPIKHFRLIPPTNRRPNRAHSQNNRTDITCFRAEKNDDYLNFLSLDDFLQYSVHSAIKFPPFEALYGLNPPAPATLLTKHPRSGPSSIVTSIHDIHDLITKELKLSDVYKSTYADRHSTRHAFSENDRVWQLASQESPMCQISPTMHWTFLIFGQNFIPSLTPSFTSLNGIPQRFSNF